RPGPGGFLDAEQDALGLSAKLAVVAEDVLPLHLGDGGAAVEEAAGDRYPKLRERRRPLDHTRMGIRGDWIDYRARQWRRIDGKGRNECSLPVSPAEVAAALDDIDFLDFPLPD